MLLRNPRHQVQAETGAAQRFGSVNADTVEAFKNTRLLILRETGAGIFDARTG